MAFDALGEWFNNDLECAIYSGDDICPKCFGELDTGWECNRCGWDCVNHTYPKKDGTTDKGGQ